MPELESSGRRESTIAIVGGGLGGLALATGLQKQGVKFEIYEGTLSTASPVHLRRTNGQKAASQFSEIGALVYSNFAARWPLLNDIRGISLQYNAQRALELLDPAVSAGFERLRADPSLGDGKTQILTFRRADKCNQNLQSAHTWTTGREAGFGNVHRAHFMDLLVEHIPKDVAHLNKRLVRIEEANESVTLHFADGSTATHSAVIGCDGIKSVTRSQVLGKSSPAASPVFSGKYAYRGLVSMEKAREVLGDLAYGQQFFLGSGGHILTTPISHGQLFNIVAFSSKKDGKWEGDWVKPGDKASMISDFEGWAEPVQKILGMMQKTDVWALFDHPPADSYVSAGGRVCLLGDAAHASTPHQGAGAGQAVEDALILSSVLGLVGDGTDLKRAFAAYDQVRRPRSQKQVWTARYTGEVYDLEAAGVGEDLEKVEQVMLDKGWLWQYDITADVEEVARLYREALKK